MTPEQVTEIVQAIGDVETMLKIIVAFVAGLLGCIVGALLGWRRR